MEKREIILSIIIAVLSSGVLNVIITNILYNSKLKKELKYKGSDLHAREIEKSLQAFRELELKLKNQEIYQIEDELQTRGVEVNFFGGECIYPAIFNDWESLNEFNEMIQQCRLNHEKNLSCKLALNLVFIDRYIMQVRIYIAKNKLSIPSWGTIFIVDLQKWQRKVDKLIVKELNNYNYSLESHESRKWLRLRKYELQEQYDSTILNYLITGKGKSYNKKQLKYLEALRNNLKDLNQQELRV